ncbi:hypothetical protein KAS50_10230 [bacterium]|nr:hypothetical protein [bacterium]
MTYFCQASSEGIDNVASEYVSLSLRIDKHHRGFVDAYTGDELIRKSIENEDIASLSELKNHSEELLKRLERLDKRTDRSEFLKKQITAAHTFIRKLSGENFTLIEEAKLLFDIEPEMVPETFYTDAINTINSLLPGKEEAWKKLERFRKPLFLDDNELEPVIERCLEEVRKRTNAFLPIPPGESVTLKFVTNKPWGGYNWFKGNAHSLIEINTDLPRSIDQILHYAAHEGYPGHHTDLMLKEQFLYKEKGFIEYSVFPLYAPQSLIAEGIAEAGIDVIFSEQEILSFIKNVLFPMKGLKSFDIEKWRSIRNSLKVLSSISGNAAILLFEKKKSEADVINYLKEYGLFNEDSAVKRLDFIKTYRAYVFNYYYGYNLVREYLEKGNQEELFKKLILGHIYPSLLKK